MRVAVTLFLALQCGPLVAQVQDSLDIKIGQMIIVGMLGQEVDSVLADEISAGQIGGLVIYEKNLHPEQTFDRLKQLTTDLQALSPTPLFLGIDQEGGKVNRLKTKYGFPPMPSAEYLGSFDTTDSTRFYGDVIGSTLSSVGLNMNFAPVVDVAINPSNPVIAGIERSFSANANEVAAHARAYVAGHRKAGVLTVLKHFPGHGSSTSDSHKGIADVTNTWKKEEIDPYKILLGVGDVDAIMTAHIVNLKLEPDSLPATLSKKIMTGLLRDSLKYDGVIFSDDMQMHAISKYYGVENAIKLSILAGVDMLMFSNNIRDTQERAAAFVHRIISGLVESGVVSEERITESYNRIMNLKSRLG